MKSVPLEVDFHFGIPRNNGSLLTETMRPGESIFILGANGVGKSSLLQTIFTSNYTKATRISAHRQTWFTSNSINLSPEQKRNTEQNILNSDTGQASRWKDDYSAQRSSIAIYDLVDAENVRAREITSAVDLANIDLAQKLSKKSAPIKIINEILKASNMPIEISVERNEQIIARKNGGAPYSVAELSDGERNALLLAATVLTAASNKLLIIDEPERHLHRSIISPLLTLLFAKRDDCAFIISTHDVLLPIDNPSAKIILVRGCIYNGQSPVSWEADLVEDQSLIDEDLKKDILGSRRKIIFVEGNEKSLDKPLYSLMFPESSVIPKASCRDVQNSVLGIQNANNLHWINAVGIIDNDRRTIEEIKNLESKNIYSVPFYSVESVYYHPYLINRIIERYVQINGGCPIEIFSKAKSAFILAIRNHADRLVSRSVEKEIRDELERMWPNQSAISSGKPISINLDIKPFLQREKSIISQAIEIEDVEKIITKYPIRETPALNDLSKAIGYQNQGKYEAAVIKLLTDDKDALNYLRDLFGSLRRHFSV